MDSYAPPNIEPNVPSDMFVDSKLYFDPSGRCKLSTPAKPGERCPSVVKSKTTNKTRHLKEDHNLEQATKGIYETLIATYVLQVLTSHIAALEARKQPKIGQSSFERPTGLPTEPTRALI